MKGTAETSVTRTQEFVFVSKNTSSRISQELTKFSKFLCLRTEDVKNDLPSFNTCVSENIDKQ